MVSKELRHAQLSGSTPGGLPPLRQLIVTANSTLCANIKSTIEGIHSTAAAAKQAAAAAAAAGLAHDVRGMGAEDEPSEPEVVAVAAPAAVKIEVLMLADEVEANQMVGLPESMDAATDEQCAPMAITLRWAGRGVLPLGCKQLGVRTMFQVQFCGRAARPGPNLSHADAWDGDSSGEMNASCSVRFSPFSSVSGRAWCGFSPT